MTIARYAPGVAAITGAGSGIGRALAIKAARSGLNTALCDVEAAGLAETAALVEAAGARATAVVADVRDRSRMAAFAAAAWALGPVTLLFANAGVLRPGPASTQPAADWDLMIDVNLKGLVNTVQAFAAAMQARQEPSRIVLTGSQASIVAYPKLPLYSATKHAVWALAEGLRDEMAQVSPHVGVSLLCPGAVATPMTGDKPGYMDPADLADRVFDAIGQDRFWIFTHPRFRAAVEARLAALQAEAWS